MLNPSDKKLSQVVEMQDLLTRGLAMHHAGLLPTLKEVHLRESIFLCLQIFFLLFLWQFFRLLRFCSPKGMLKSYSLPKHLPLVSTCLPDQLYLIVFKNMTATKRGFSFQVFQTNFLRNRIKNFWFRRIYPNGRQSWTTRTGQDRNRYHVDQTKFHSLFSRRSEKNSHGISGSTGIEI